MTDQLDTRLSRWAEVRRLNDEQANAVHAAILQAVSNDPPAELDADWFWGLLRPLTSLLDGPNPLGETLAGLISVGA